MITDHRDLLHRLWCEVLTLETIGDDDDFFTVGGNSIKAMSLARRIERETGQRLRIADVLRASTIRRQLSLLSTNKAHTGLTITPAPDTYYMASSIQLDFFLLDQMASREERAHVTTVRLVEEGIAPGPASLAFAQIVARHSLLRTKFSFRHGMIETEQTTAENCAHFSFHDITGSSLQSLYEHELHKPLDIQDGPLVRLVLAAIAPNRSALLLSIHHIVSDGFSADILLDDFLAFLRGDHPSPVLLSDYRDYAHALEAWLDSEHGKRSRQFWQQHFADFRAPDAFTGRAISARNCFVGGRESFTLDPIVHERLRTLCAAPNTGLFVVLQSSIKAFLYLETQAEDIVTGCAVSTRDAADLSGQVGPFMNTLPIRTRISCDRPLHSIIADVKEATLEAFDNKLVPLTTISGDLKRRDPLFDVGFTLQNHATAPDTSPTMPRRPPDHSELISALLWFVAWEREDELTIDLHYRKGAFTSNEARAIMDRFKYSLSLLLGAPDTPLSQLFPGPDLSSPGSIGFNFDTF